ncbi:MAG: hypothetical protein EHM61_11915 [Acidobacteria bacterium]|nr:MAG: hypothetical protein EHM61_11915 [Acidobacteriota bacterium]
MKNRFVAVFGLALLILLSPAVQGQIGSRTESTDGIRDFLTIGLPVDTKVEIKLKGTSRLPDADAKVELENEKGTTRVEAKVDDLKPALLFGGDFNTYVLWLITPEGEVQNLGELVLDDDDAELKTTTPLSNFGLFVTAEPHFLVDSPSRMIVLEMEEPDNIRIRQSAVAQLRYEGVTGLYDFTRDTLAQAPEIKRDDLALDVAQARTAVRLAERSGAGQFSAAELQAARQALQRAEEAVATKKDSDERIGLSREAVRLAVRAQTTAQTRLFEAELEGERQRNEQEAARLKAAIEAAQSEADRARLEAEQQRLQTTMEQQARQRAVEQAERMRQMTEQREQVSQAEERGRQQGFNEALQASREAEQRYRQLALDSQRREQMVLEAERTVRQAEQTQQELQQRQQEVQDQQRDVEQQRADATAAQQEVERARSLLEQARKEAQQSRDQAQLAQDEAQRARDLAQQREQELQSERQARQQTQAELNQLQSEQRQTREQLRNALGQIAETRESVEGLIVNLPDILFEFDSATLKPQAREILEKLAGALQAAGANRITIEGHTDSVGRPDYNQQLSQARAQSVRQFLVQSGLDPSLVVEVRGVGEREPRDSNDTADGRQENRRVEILVHEPGAAPARAE